MPSKNRPVRLLMLLQLIPGALLAGNDLSISVRHTQLTTGQPLVVSVTGEAACPNVFGPTLGDGYVEFAFSDFCPILPPSPGPFAHHELAGPLAAGIWEIRLLDLDVPVSPPPVVDRIEVTVTDPRYAIEAAPPTATEDDAVTAQLRVYGSCFYSEVEPIASGRIRINVHEIGLCDPPPLFDTYEFEKPLGQLEAGEYLLELYYEDSRVAEDRLTVLPSGACVPDSTTLCLNENRFRVQASWTTPSGGSGSGKSVVETSESGYFWFFSPDNIELAVKVLDACDTPFASFWVFAAGLTNVGVQLTVTDTRTDTTVTYDNPLGRRFETITDTRAFETCP